MKVARSQANLIHNLLASLDGTTPENQGQRSLDAMFVEAVVKRHVLPPTALGNKRSGLAYKLA